MALRDAVGFTYLLLWVSIVSCFKQKIREGVNWLIMVRSPEGEAKAHSFTLSPACFLDPSFRFLLGTQVIRKAVFFTSRRGYSAGGSKSDHLVRRMGSLVDILQPNDNASISILTSFLDAWSLCSHFIKGKVGCTHMKKRVARVKAISSILLI